MTEYMDICDSAPRYVGGYAYQKLRKLGLSDAVARICAKEVKIVSYEPHQYIWRRGDDVKTWNCVITGMVAASMPTEHSLAAPIALYGDNSWFGEFSVLNRKPAYADFISLLSTDVMTLPAPIVLQRMDEEPGFGSAVARMISWRAQKTSEMLMLMKHGNPCLRVVMGICQFAESLAYSAERPPTIGYGEGVTIPVIQEVLAALCGVSRSKLSEFVHLLSVNGWLRIAYGKVEILSLQTWHKFAAMQRERGFKRLSPDINELLAELQQCDTF